MNVKVTLIHDGAPEAMRRAAERVISGDVLKATTIEGRAEEAKAIYNRMMGIRSTTHEYKVEETTEPATIIEQTPVSEAGLYQQRQEDKVLSRMADMLAAGIAEGVAKALAERDRPPAQTQKAATNLQPIETSLPVDTESAAIDTVSGTMTLRSKKRRPAL